MSVVYRLPGATTHERTVQEAVDLVWFSLPDEDPIVIEELEDDKVTAVWVVPRPYESDTPPTASLSHREEC